MTINEKIENLSKLYEDLYKEKNKKIKFPNKIKEINEKIKKLKEQLINPDEGTYFGIYKKLKSDTNWIFDGKIFVNKIDAEEVLKSLQNKSINNSFNENHLYDSFEIRSIVVQETDIKG